MCHLQESDLGAITGCATSVATLAERRAIPQMLARLSEKLDCPMSVIHVIAMPVFSPMAPWVSRHYRR